MESWAIPLAALIVSAAALLLVAIQSATAQRVATETRREAATAAEEARMQSANKDYVDQLEKRVTECEKGRHELRQEADTAKRRYEEENTRLNARYDQLRDENHDLRLRMLEVEKGQA